MPEFFGGFYGLTNFDVFENRLKTICATIETETGVVAAIDDDRLSSAYLDWLGQYRSMMERWQSRRQIPLMIAALIEAIRRAGIVRYRVETSGAVVSRSGYIVAAYPDEITALAFGATMYSSVIQRLTGHDPSCPLTPQQIEYAAKQLRQNPARARHFRRLLKLKTSPR